MANACPLCDFTAASDRERRHHLSRVHDWDPSGEPTYVGDMLVAVGFGFVAFLALMTTAICTSGGPQTRSCEQLGAWMLVGLASFVAGILVLFIQPLRRTGRRRWIAIGLARKVHRKVHLSPTARAHLRRIDAAISALIAAAFGGIFLYQIVPGEIGLLATAASVATLAALAFARARIRRRANL
jgi:hypothetical protein